MRMVNRKFTKKVGLKLLANLAILMMLLLIIVSLTQFPRNFNFVYEDGKTVSNTPMSVVRENITNYLRMIRNGTAMDTMLISRGQSIGEVLKPAFSKTLTLFFFSVILSLLIGIPKGIFDSRRGNKKGTFKLLQTLIPLSLPDVLTISIVQMGGYYLYTNNFSFFGLGPILYMGHQDWTQAIYPVIALSLVPAAYIARITASSIESVYGKEYILAAQGKGCSEIRIIRAHTMKNVLAEVISGFPTIVSLLFSSLVIVERVFYYPGMTYEMLKLYTSQKDMAASMTAFTTFALVLGVTYYFVFALSNLLKQIILPQLREE